MAHGGNITDRVVRIDKRVDQGSHGQNTFNRNALVAEGDDLFFAVRESETHGVFSLRKAGFRPADDYWSAGYYPDPDETGGAIYQPLHPEMLPEDIRGATYAHNDGTYWRIAHCSPHEQMDFAASAKSFAFAAFDEEIARAQATLGNLNTSSKALAYGVLRALIDLAHQASVEVLTRVQFAALGHYHKNPHHDHRRDLALAAVDKVWAAWQKNGSRLTDRTRIAPHYRRVRAALAAQYTISWAYELAAEKAAIGDDPVRGFEYCYTLSADGAVIAGAGNIPDPNWEFDAFPKSGQITRGTQTYHDRQPATTEGQPFVIRFRRPVPAGTNRGVSIGSVAWRQEPAIRVG